MARAVEKAFQVIRDAILEGHYSAGERITEAEVVKAAGVSRTPVREALRRLEAEGWLQFAPNQGAVVTTWNQADVDEIFGLRADLESLVARRACLRARRSDHNGLQTLARKQWVASKGTPDLDKINELNSRFHDKLTALADSPRLDTALRGLTVASLVVQTFRYYTQSDLLRSANHHIEIADAIKVGDDKWAAAVMKAHVLAARMVLKRHWSRIASDSNEAA